MRKLIKRIREPLTQDIIIFTGLTIMLAASVLAAHYLGGSLSVVEWRLSTMLENIRQLNPWVEYGVSAALVLLVFAFLVHVRDKLMPYDARGAARWDPAQEL
ncbi:MAG: hypothetical protein AB7Q01_10470 [Gammaproteobacteria bacterium]